MSGIDLDLWKLAAGLGLFLYSMYMIESALKELASKKFKLFLQKTTANNLIAVLNGIFSTALLQSSSLVMLLVIAFAGSGVLTLANSLGIILGANIGTTLKGWIVSYFGFSVAMENFVMQTLAIGALGLVFFQKRRVLLNLSLFVLSLGFVILSLEWMKSSMTGLSDVLDVSFFAGLKWFEAFGVGLVVTALIQSSSAMMTLTLSALHAGWIPLELAIFVAIGADLGTTGTGLLASFRGSSTKKRVGLAHFIFNVVTGFVALVLALPLLSILQKQFGIMNPLSALVAFHLSFNLLGALMFLPFLKPFENFLMSLFSKEGPKTRFIHSVPSEVPELYLIACHKEVHALQCEVIQFQMQTLRSFGFAEALPETYLKMKHWEDEVLKGLSLLQVQTLDEEESQQLDRIRIQLRSLAESAKSAKDVIHNLQQLEQSLELSHEKFLEKLKHEYSALFEELGGLNGHKEDYLALIEKNSAVFERINQWIYSLPLQVEHDQEIPLGTLLNVNREFYHAISLQLKAQI